MYVQKSLVFLHLLALMEQIIPVYFFVLIHAVLLSPRIRQHQAKLATAVCIKPLQVLCKNIYKCMYNSIICFCNPICVPYFVCTFMFTLHIFLMEELTELFIKQTKRPMKGKQSNQRMIHNKNFKEKTIMQCSLHHSIT